MTLRTYHCSRSVLEEVPYFSNTAHSLVLHYMSRFKNFFCLQGLTIIIDLGSNAVKAGFVQEDGMYNIAYFREFLRISVD